MKKQWVSILLFLLLLGTFNIYTLFFYSPQGTRHSVIHDDRRQQEVFTQVHYFNLLNKRPYFQLDARELVSISGGILKFLLPEGKLYGEAVGEELTYKANFGDFTKKDRIVSLGGGLELFYKSFSLKGDQGQYFFKGETFIGKGNIITKGRDEKTGDKITIESAEVESRIKKKWSRYKGDVKGVIDRRLSYQGKVYFAAENIVANLLTSHMLLEKDVRLKKENIDVSAQKGEIFLENFNKKLKYYVLNDDVVVNQKVRERTSGKWITRKAYSESLEGVNGSKKLILSGAPKVISGKDIIRGSEIVLRENASVIEVTDSSSHFIYKGNGQ